jgi:hypothetical protein
MLSAVWEWLKSLFHGKGTMQIGKGNQSVSGLTTGDVAGPVAVGTGNVINYHAAEAREKTVTIKPTPAEVEILCRLETSQTGYLNAVAYDGGFEVLIDGATLGGPPGAGASVQLHEAIQRLLGYQLLTDIQRNGQVYHLSSQGREVARKLRNQIEGGERPDFTGVERLMPELLAEMKADYASAPLIRELIVMDTEGNVYNGHGVFAYYRSKDPDLDSKIQILENHGLIENITYNNTERYRVKEKFARYLTGR